jgi:hypothetical protein
MVFIIGIKLLLLACTLSFIGHRFLRDLYFFCDAANKTAERLGENRIMRSMQNWMNLLPACTGVT